MPVLLLSHEKKCDRQLFLSSAAELLQERFSNIFSAPLKETCWWEMGWSWQDLAGEGLARPCREQELVPESALSDCRWLHPSPFLGADTAFLPRPRQAPISAYLLPFTCFQTELCPCLWLCPCPVPTTFPSSPFHLHVPYSLLGTLFRDVSAKLLSLYHSFSPFWIKKTYLAFSGFSLFLMRVLKIKHLNTHWIAGWNSSPFSPVRTLPTKTIIF